MDKKLCDHPLSEFFCGSISYDYTGTSENIFDYKIQISLVSQPNIFFDESNLIKNKRMLDILDYLEKNNADFFIQDGMDRLYETKELVDALKNSPSKAEEMYYNTYFYFLATDNNKKIIIDFMKSFSKNNKDLKYHIEIREYKTKLLFNAVYIPNHYMVNDSFIENELILLTSTLTSKENEMNQFFKSLGLDLKVIFKIKDFTAHLLIPRFSIMKESDSSKIIYNDLVKEALVSAFQNVFSGGNKKTKVEYKFKTNSNNNLIFESVDVLLNTNFFKK